MGLLNFIGGSLDKKLVEENVNRFIREVDTFMSAYEKVGIEKMYGFKNQLKTMQAILTTTPRSLNHMKRISIISCRLEFHS